MNSDNIILRGTDNPPLVNKDDVLTIEEIDSNFIAIYNDFISLSNAEDTTLTFDVDRTYLVGEYSTYDGRMWVATEISTGVTPIEGSADWNDIFPTILAHEKNKDTILDEGGVNETTVAEIRAFIDAGLTSTTNLSLSTKTATSFKIESSTGADVTIPQANNEEAGLLNATDKVKLNNLTGVNTGDQTLVSLNAEDVDNKVTDFTTINNTLYPTTQAVDTYVTAVVPDLVDTFLDSNVELNTNKATTFATINDILYPTVKAVDDQLDLKSNIANPTFTGLTTLDTFKVTTGNYITPVDVVGIDVLGNVNRISASNGRTALGLGTLATQSGTFSGTSSGTNTGDQTFLNARVQTVTSSATVTPTSTNDLVIITAQAVGLTLANPTGTFTEGQALMIRIKDNATARAITFDTNYRAIGVTLPTTTVISKTMYLGIIYNSTDGKWDVIGYNIQA